jgi:hypothetical protein
MRRKQIAWDDTFDIKLQRMVYGVSEDKEKTIREFKTFIYDKLDAQEAAMKKKYS